MPGSAKVYAENNQISADHSRLSSAGGAMALVTAAAQAPRRSLPRRLPGWRSARSSVRARFTGPRIVRASSMPMVAGRADVRDTGTAAGPVVASPRPARRGALASCVLERRGTLLRLPQLPFRLPGGLRKDQLSGGRCRLTSGLQFCHGGRTEGRPFAIGYYSLILDEDSLRVGMTGAWSAVVDCH